MKKRKRKLGYCGILRTFGTRHREEDNDIRARMRRGQGNRNSETKYEKTSCSIHTIFIPFGGMNKR